MELIKENKEKQRIVYKTDTLSYIKRWRGKDFKWLTGHINDLHDVCPGYVIAHGWDGDSVWAEFKPIKGVTANNFTHTPEFVERITEYCKNNYKKTYPYAHGDWVLSNILIDGDQIDMCDWDNLGKYPQEEVLEKMRSDLKSAFGDKFDPTSI
jgi:hypothetical protein